MEQYIIPIIIGLLLIVVILLDKYKIKYKGECIIHNWKYSYRRGDYWKYNNKSYGRFLKENEHYYCTKCYKEKKV